MSTKWLRSGREQIDRLWYDFPHRDVSITLILNLDKICGGLAIVLISAPLAYLVQDNWTTNRDICVMSMA